MTDKRKVNTKSGRLCKSKCTC